MSQAVICPVCEGEGERLRRPVSHGDKLVQCWGCGGKGWVEVGKLREATWSVDTTTGAFKPE